MVLILTQMKKKANHLLQRRMKTQQEMLRKNYQARKSRKKKKRINFQEGQGKLRNQHKRIKRYPYNFKSYLLKDNKICKVYSIWKTICLMPLGIHKNKSIMMQQVMLKKLARIHMMDMFVPIFQSSHVVMLMNLVISMTEKSEKKFTSATKLC